MLLIIPPICHIVIFFIQSPLPQTNQNLMNAKESLSASILCPSRPAVPRLGAYSPSLPLLLCSSFARHSIIAGKFVICYGWPVKCYARPLRPSPPSPLFSISVGDEEKEKKETKTKKEDRINVQLGNILLASNRSEGKKNNVLGAASVLSFLSLLSLPQLLSSYLPSFLARSLVFAAVLRRLFLLTLKTAAVEAL